MRFWVFVGLLMGMLSGTRVAWADSSPLDQITAAINGQQSELEKLDALLRDPDRNRRIAAITMLLKSGNPLYVQRAREAGLASSDVEMQAAALGAIMDSGGPFKLVVDISGTEDDQDGIKSWMGSEGNWDDAIGKAIFVFRLGEFDKKNGCWKRPGINACGVTIVGSNIIFQWPPATASFQLSGEGSLEGLLRNTNGDNKPVPAKIPLIE
jgi:hypothetical protein